MSCQQLIASSPLFTLGAVVATPGALAALDQHAIHAWTLLARHESGDWGEVPPGDWSENDWSVANGFRILSSYSLGADTRIWIITEADRSVTTVLLPDEY